MSREGDPGPDPPAGDPAPLTPDLQTAPLAVVLGRLGIDRAATDLLVVGDGSGNRWDHGGGWAAVVVDLRTGNRKLLTGAYSSATNMVCELLPYLHALYWYHEVAGKGARQQLGRPLRVAVVSDNETVVKQGNGEWKMKAMAPLWASIIELKRTAGMVVRWHWAARDTIGLNVLCDHMSRHARLTHEARVTLVAAVPGDPPVSVFDVNPL